MRDSFASPKETFGKLNAWGVAFAKKKGIKESDITGIVERVRKRV